MSKFLELLALIRSYGDRIPALMEQVEIIIAAVSAISDILKPGVFAASAAELSADEQTQVDLILSECPPKGPLTNLFAFIKAHPELITFLLTFLKK